MKMDIDEACKHVLQHYIEERNKAVHCTICDKVLFSYEKTIIRYVNMLEVKDEITWDMTGRIYTYMHYNYPYKKDGTLHRHHVNYKKDIQIPVCSTCHHKIHNRSEPEWVKWKPVDEKPSKQGCFETKLYKPLEIKQVVEVIK